MSTVRIQSPVLIIFILVLPVPTWMAFELEILTWEFIRAAEQVRVIEPIKSPHPCAMSQFFVVDISPNTLRGP